MDFVNFCKGLFNRNTKKEEIKKHHMEIRDENQIIRECMNNVVEISNDVIEISFEFLPPQIVKGGYSFSGPKEEERSLFRIFGLQLRVFGEKEMDTNLYAKIIEKGVFTLDIKHKNYIGLPLGVIPSVEPILIPNIDEENEGKKHPSFYYNLGTKRGLVIPYSDSYSAEMKFVDIIPIEYPIRLKIYLLIVRGMFWLAESG